MKWRLIPKEEKFFDMFQAQIDHVVKSAKLLLEFLENYEQMDVEVKANEIRRMEHDGDILTHDILRKLNQTFVTPIDREDIHELATRMDDILDLIEGTVNRMKLFKIRKVTPEIIQLSRIVLQASEELAKAIGKMRNLSHILDHCVEVNRLENEADILTRNIIGCLFENNPDPIEVIKWKELYEYLELATDKCEDVANILEGIMLKYA
ncbi:MAG: DUF47 family protein [bacterium]|nr:DUF47 family protein [bacterium]